MPIKLNRHAARYTSILASATTFAVFSSAIAQSYPNKPLRLLVPAAAGGVSDIAARAMLPMLTQALGQQVIAENRVGANGNIGTEFCAKTAADGYTACYLQGTLVAINPLAYGSVPFNMERDFAPVAHLNWFESAIVVNAAVPANNLRELMDLARAKPGTLNWGSIGIGSSSHLYLEWFQAKTGARFNHIPYKSNPELLQAAINGDVPAMLNTPGATLQLAKAGKLRVLGVINRRSALQPDVPTLGEQGYDLDFRNWNAIFFQRGVSNDIIQRWNAESNKIVRDKAWEEKFLRPASLSSSGGTVEDLAQIVRTSQATAVELVKLAKLKFE
ncbi:MAG: Bug family tripartite tricarboxylate transporter substrate binding protein [Burkholderiales bacterium]